MIVKKPISAVKIGKSSYRLTVGKPAPKNVVDYWILTKQIEDLKRTGAIVDESGNNISGNNKKSEKESSSNESLLKNESR